MRRLVGLFWLFRKMGIFVGWVERSETHHLRRFVMGFAIALPILHLPILRVMGSVCS